MLCVNYPKAQRNPALLTFRISSDVNKAEIQTFLPPKKEKGMQFTG